MNQLIFSNDFDKIIEEPIDYISNIDDISPNIINNIKDISNKIAIYNICDGTTICSNCFNKLNKNYYCKHCHKSFYHPYEDELRYKNAIMNYNEIDEIKNIEDNIKYYFFDIVKGNILLYVIKEHIYFNNPLTPLPFKTSSLSIQEVWHIKEDYMTNLITKEVTIYNDIDNKIDDMEEKERVYDLLYDTYLCLNNLDILKNTIYKYSLIWEGVKHLKLVKPCLVNMVYAPIHLKQFEYLVKNKLYNLAFDYTCTLNYDNKLKKLLKANLDFLQKNDLDYYHFLAFELCQKQDLDLINYCMQHLYLLKEITETANITVEELRDYFAQQEDFNEEYYVDYNDYLRMLKEEGYNIKDKKNIFPTNFYEAHNKLYLEYTISKDKKINDKINKFSKILELNSYQDDQYIIIPASSIESLIDESKQQSNCVRTYSRRYSNKETELYFMRKKDKFDESFVTIEVKNGKIVQARTKYNQLPSDDIMNILKRWEHNLIIIETNIKESDDN